MYNFHFKGSKDSTSQEVESENPEDVKYESEKARDEDMTNLTRPDKMVKHKCNSKLDYQINQFKSFISNDNSEAGLYGSLGNEENSSKVVKIDMAQWTK